MAVDPEPTVARPAARGRDRLRARACPALAEEIIEAISQGVPEYALPLEGSFGRGLRRGVEEALRPLPRPVRQRGRRRRPAPRDLHRAGAGRTARRPAAGGAAGGLPPGRAGGLAAPGGGGRGGRARARDALPACRVDLRLHRRDLGRIGGGLCAGAGRRRGGDPAPPPRAGAAAGPGPARRSRGGPHRCAGGRLGAAGPVGRGRRAHRAMPDAPGPAPGAGRHRGRAIPAGACALVPDPDAPGPQGPDRGSAGRHAGPRSAPPARSDRGPAQRAAGPARRWRWTGKGWSWPTTTASTCSWRRTRA